MSTSEKKKDKKLPAPVGGELRRDAEEEVKVEGHWKIVGPGNPAVKSNGEYRTAFDGTSLDAHTVDEGNNSRC